MEEDNQSVPSPEELDKIEKAVDSDWQKIAQNFEKDAESELKDFAWFFDNATDMLLWKHSYLYCREHGEILKSKYEVLHNLIQSIVKLRNAEKSDEFILAFLIGRIEAEARLLKGFTMIFARDSAYKKLEEQEEEEDSPSWVDFVTKPKEPNASQGHPKRPLEFRLRDLDAYTLSYKKRIRKRQQELLNLKKQHEEQDSPPKE